MFRYLLEEFDSIFEIVFDPATFSLDESRKYSVGLTGGPNRTGPGGAASPAPARLWRAGAGQAAPPGPVRFGSSVVENHPFLSCWIFLSV